MNTWIIGCGDIGRRVSALYNAQASHKNIHGIIQSKSSQILCEAANIETTKLNLDEPYQFSVDKFKEANLFYFAPPPLTGTSDPRLENFLNYIKDQPKRIVLISTTGIYGDSKGNWIDENTPSNPTADRAHRRLSAEKSLKHWATKYDKEFMILRVPGIYAKDRLPLSRLKKGLAVVNENEAGWTNRIHADDLAQACKAAMHCDYINQTINVTDGNPSSMTDYFNQVADYAKLPRPPQISMKDAERTLSEGMVSYLKESRRIKNEKMLKVLKIKLKYPTLASALNSPI